MRPIHRDPFVWTVLALFTALSLAWGLLLPPFEAPDEQNHYRYMVFLKDQGRLPRQLPLPPEVWGEGHQPPLYYLAGAGALKALYPHAAFVEPPRRMDFRFNSQPTYFQSLTPGSAADPSRPVHVLRILQLFLPLLSLAGLWLLLAALGLDGPEGKLALALLALNPGWCFLSGALNNDHLANAAFSWALLGLALAARKGRMKQSMAVALGAVLAVGALAKLDVLPLLPLALAAAWVWSPGKRLANLAWLGGLPLALAFWWYARNWSVYGDPFGWAMHRLTCANTVHPKALTDLGWWQFWLTRSFDSFWGVFGWMTWRAPMAWTWTALGGVGAAVAGMAQQGGWPRSQGGRRAAMVLTVAAGAVVLGVARFGLEFDPPEGRYFYPALSAWGVALAWGWRPWLQKLHPSWAAALPWVLAAALTAFNLWLLFTRLCPLYYPAV